MCFDGGRQSFVLFEGRDVKRSVYSASLPALASNESQAYFRAYKDVGGVRVGERISADQSVDESLFLHVARSSDGGLNADVVSVAMGIRYRYHYDLQGALLRAEITGFDGNVRTLTR
jgi:hypothetical protein